MSAIRTESCSFSGQKFAPGHGTVYVRVNGDTYRFMSHKARVMFENKWNARKIDWTVPARIALGKETMSVTRKSNRRAARRVERGIANCSAEEMNQRIQAAKQ